MSYSKKVLFVVAEGRYFVSHRLHLARAAVAEGYSVAVLCRVGDYREKIETVGVEVFDWQLNRGSLNPWREILAIWRLIITLRQYRPSLVHAVAIKPIIYTALSARFLKVGSIVYALSGLGFVFSSKRFLARLLRPGLLILFRWMFGQKNVRLILQNPDDCALLLHAQVVIPDRVRLIRGSGVDTNFFSPRFYSLDTQLVVLPARLLWDKGVGEFVAAARHLKGIGYAARFVLVGEPDPHNPECVSRSQVDAWVSEGVIEAWGGRDDMPEVLNQASVICLPSYREGLPKALLEAASCGKPIVTFDVPGCREVVADGINGLLVPFKNVPALSDALARLLSDPVLCERMGRAGRERVLQEFSQEQIAKETLLVWSELLS